MTTTDDHGIDDELDLDGAVCVVTGATRGIGRAAALALGRSGAHVVVVGRSTQQRPDSFAPGTLEEVVAQLDGEGIPALAVPGRPHRSRGRRRAWSNAPSSGGGAATYW